MINPAARQITYSGMLWLLVCQLLVMLPFTFYLPLWLIPVLVITSIWRLRVLKGHSAQPGTPIKLLLILAGLAALALSGLGFPSLDVMVAMLLLGFAFKTLEVIQQRDALIVVFLGYFLVAVHFLYSQSIPAALFAVIALMVLTAALIGVQYPLPNMGTAQNTRHNLRLGGLLLLQCLPLMLIIFLFAPRLPPLFTLPLTTNQAKTGVTDSMAPGDIAQLSQSGELAFRVTFKGKRPPQNQLYWRGLTLNHFDGVRWRQFDDEHDLYRLKQSFASLYRWRPDNLQITGEAIEYEVVYEKTQQPWLFTLTPSTEVYGEVMRAADYRVMATRELQSPLLLRAVSYPDSKRDLELDNYIRRLTLHLPPNSDPKSLALAKQLHAASNSDAHYIQKVLRYYQQQQFSYTLRPPLLGDSNTIDAFLFESRRGFCAHFAGSFVFMMRAAGIPARVVAGYQGGEWNESGGYLSIHQFDAHAWTEVWLPETGWKRIDPTSMVSPERTELGLEAAMLEEGSFLENELFSTRKIRWLNNLSQQFDKLQYGWRRWVLGYDGQSQREFLEGLLGKLSMAKLAWTLGIVFAVMGLLWIWMLGLHQKHLPLPPEQRLYQKFCKLLAKKGIIRQPAQTPRQFAQLAASQLPEQAGGILEFNRLYEKVSYDCTTIEEQKEIILLLKQRMAQLR